MREFRTAYNAPCRSEKSGNPGYATVCQDPTGTGPCGARPICKLVRNRPNLPLLFAGVGLPSRLRGVAIVGLDAAAIHADIFHFPRTTVKHPFLSALKDGVSWTI